MWQPANFLIASHYGPTERAGYTYRSLGLHMMWKASPKGRRPPCWALTHLGSGHAIVFIVGHVATAFPIATEIAECSDWDFDGLDGWRNRDPEIIEKLRAVLAKYPAKSLRYGRGNANEECASQSLMAPRSSATSIQSNCFGAAG